MRILVLFSIMNLISLSMTSFQKGDSEDSITSLKELGSPSIRWVKKSSLKDVIVLVLLLLLGSESTVRVELEEGISEIERVIEGSLRILDLREKMLSK